MRYTVIPKLRASVAGIAAPTEQVVVYLALMTDNRRGNAA